MTTTARQFKVLQHRLPWLNDKLGALAKRAAKLGVVPPTVEQWGQPFSEPDLIGNVAVYCNVVITGEAPVLPGWALVAVINVLEGEGIIKSLPGVTLPDSFKTCDAQWCDHCRTRRIRNDTFVLQQDDGVTFRQVGRTCLKDFIPGGHTSPDALAWWANAIDIAVSAAREAGEPDGQGGGKHYTDLASFLGFVSYSSREYGWISRKDAYENNKTATADTAMHLMALARPVTTADDRKLAVDAVEWAASLSDNQTESNEFMHNVRTLARLGVVDHRTYRIAAATITAYQRDRKNSQQALKPVAQRGYVGQLGKLAEFRATVVGEPFSFTGQYGVTNVYRFSVGGDLVVWYSNKLIVALKPGVEVTLKGMVKSQEVYRPKSGEASPQTVINYAQVV